MPDVVEPAPEPTGFAARSDVQIRRRRRIPARRLSSANRFPD